jgi:hypothetical protein
MLWEDRENHCALPDACSAGFFLAAAFFQRRPSDRFLIELFYQNDIPANIQTKTAKASSDETVVEYVESQQS